jgi:2-keto-4-pentenoate hydratase/2-oxohepta-3-ene-1,7-dioic acid hydratase in catechol pathway
VLAAQTTMGVARVDDRGYEIVDVSGASLSALVSSGELALVAEARAVKTLAAEEVGLLSPVTAVGKLVIVGLNYRDHAAEVDLPLPSIPRVHLAARSAVIGPTDSIPLPPAAGSFVDYEGEVAVVIGSIAHQVSASEAWSHVAGITAANDVTARDVQDGSNTSVSGPNVGLAKSFDGFKPMGPALLSGDDVRDGRHLMVRTQVDGETRQASDTGQMEFPISELVSRISCYMTLFPGDVILTGTPGGVGLANNRFLQAGQVVTVEVEGVGVLRNTVTASPAAALHDHQSVHHTNERDDR